MGDNIETCKSCEGTGQHYGDCSICNGEGQLKSCDNISIDSLLSDIEFFLHLVPDWVKIVPKGLGAEFYGTLSYEGDLKVKKKYDALVDLISDREK